MTRKKNPSPESILSLPDDLILSCLARVSRLYYPSLSLVSKKFRSLLTSTELYETRSFLRRTESCLYVCLEFYSDNNPRWFTLYGNLMVPIPSHCSRPLSHWSCLIALGSSIYKIGGHTDPSSSVSILDCRSHTWREAPSLMVGRFCPSASVVDEKICVVGGCQDSSIDVFDSKTQTWDHVPSPDPTWELYWGCVTKSAYVEGKFHLMYGKKGMAYDPKEGRWNLVEAEMHKNWSWSYCVVENVLYSYYQGDFRWYDTAVRLWKDLKGLVGLPMFDRHAQVILADYGGKMVVFWVKNLYPNVYEKNAIWCAEITLDRRKIYEIWGKVECLDSVLPLPVPNSCELVKVLAVTL